MEIREVDPGWREGALWAAQGWLSWVWPVKRVKSLKPLPEAGLGLRLQMREGSRWSPFCYPGLVSASF